MEAIIPFVGIAILFAVIFGSGRLIEILNHMSVAPGWNRSQGESVFPTAYDVDRAAHKFVSNDLPLLRPDRPILSFKILLALIAEQNTICMQKQKVADVQVILRKHAIEEMVDWLGHACEHVTTYAERHVLRDLFIWKAVNDHLAEAEIAALIRAYIQGILSHDSFLEYRLTLDFFEPQVRDNQAVRRCNAELQKLRKGLNSLGEVKFPNSTAPAPL